MSFFLPGAARPRPPEHSSVLSALQPTLREIVELGAVAVRGGAIVEQCVPQENLYLPSRWAPTMLAISWMALEDGEYFVCLFDGWRELSRYVPPAKRVYVDWDGDLSAPFSGVGVAGEPRFAHDPSRPEVYPRLCRPVLAYARHRGDSTVVLLPDPEFIATRGYADLTRQLPPSPTRPAITASTSLYWRGSRHVDPFVLGRDRPSQREAVVSVSHSSRWIDAQFAGPGDRVGLEEQVKASPLQLDLDGMVGAWSGRFWKLLCPAVVPVRPHTPWEQWYEARMVPWVHYVPAVEGDGAPSGLGPSTEIGPPTPAALLRARQWCVDHPQECERIAAEGARLARALLEQLEAVYSNYSLRPP